jgi:cytochrome c oxidase assembly factor CtaG
VLAHVGVLAAAFGGSHMGEFLPPMIACAVYLLLYERRERTLAREGRPVASWRTLCFAAGAITAAAVQLPPFDTLADQVLAAHMIQHIIIGDVCSLLIVLGLTGPILAPVLRLRVSRPLWRLTSPLIALTLWAVDLYAWHLPITYQLAIRHDLVHALEHACMLWFGILLWMALLGPLRKPAWFGGWARVWCVISVRVIGAILANILIWAQTVYYPVYRASDAASGLNPLSDENAAGGIMMFEQILLTTILLGWLFYRHVRQDEERQDLLDLASARGVELSDERAARAAAAGEGERLRERLLRS